MDFVHLHVHSQYSLLDGAASVKGLVSKALENNMPAVAVTDHGNMFGIFNFVNEARKAGIKPIVGCEFYLVADRHIKSFSKAEPDRRYHQLLLAKNKVGYQNLSRLCSIGYVEGLYSKWPRIDKEILTKYSEGLIATSCCIGASVPQAILNKSRDEAEEEFKWWLDLFGEDYYIELQRHGLDNVDNSGMSQEDVNQVLLQWGKKYGVKAIATNDSHYINKEDANAHDILLCVNTGDIQSTPVGVGRGYRFGFPNDAFYFKTNTEMSQLFSDVPQAIENTLAIADIIDTPELKRDILLPNFVIPESFKDADDYLKHLSYQGAKRRYGVLGPDIENRLEHELGIIREMGFAGYFLIVQDFTNAARNLGVGVGPGRGSAAGSVVAYAIGITNIDPFKYDLLFERFLNPERISMPDIDMDFDDSGRQKVIDYVVEKYGKNQVAQIVTYGTMAAKLAIRDVARVKDLPLNEADRLAKLVPGTPGITLKEAYEETPELAKIRKGTGPLTDVLLEAERLEGGIRNIGIHAAGIIIAPDNITNYIPVCCTKESDLIVTQFEGKTIEDAGMLKMDFLGLKTLSIIRDCVQLINQNHGKTIDPDEIPLDDKATLELYQRGDTVGTFQFESEGMRSHLRDLKPEAFDDLIAMNALYRPGPMQFIDSFIKRKHGVEKVEYPHPLLEPILKSTYGIMVYQEQIMQAAQILGGYSLGEADLLRRAMGKKKMDVMEEQRSIFVKGCSDKNNIEPATANKIFNIMTRFAEYGFNKSHAAAYSVVAFQTAWLKTHYSAEYMASVLSNNMNDLKKVTFFMTECKDRMHLPVLGPDVNESNYGFTVNKSGEIRFGLGAVKGVGEGAVDAIVKEREAKGPFKDLFDLCCRINLQAVNKRCMESLALAGAFDSISGLNRARLFASMQDEEMNYLEKIIRTGLLFQQQKESQQQTLFGEASFEMISKPTAPDCENWTLLEQVSKEFDVTGIYLSGHPLDPFRNTIKLFCDATTESLNDLKGLSKRGTIRIAGMVSNAEHLTGKNGKPYGRMQIEDYQGKAKIVLFGDSYLNFRNYLNKDWFLFITAHVRKRYRDSDQYFLEIDNICLLQDVLDKESTKLEVNVDTKWLNDASAKRFSELMKLHKGKKPLLVRLYDKNEEMNVALLSRTSLVNIDNELLESLNSEGLVYRLHRKSH